MRSNIKKLSQSEFYRILDEIQPGKGEIKITQEYPRQLFFEKISMDGLDEMHEYSIDARLYEYLEYEPFKTIDDTKRYLKKLIENQGVEPSGRTEVCWFVRRMKDNRLIGTARLVDINFNRCSVVWGYGINPELWGDGYIYEIQDSLKEYIFERLKLNRLSGMTMINNERAKSALIASGCREEGIFRQYYRNYKGVFSDAWMYSLLAEDYSQNHATAESRLGINSISDQAIVEIVSKELQQKNISSLDSMASVSSWDSLSHIGVILALEKATGFSFTPGDIAKATSIERIYHIVNKVK